MTRTHYIQCYICEVVGITERHYGHWMHNSCYQIALRIYRQDRTQSLPEVLLKAMQRRAELPLGRTHATSKYKPPSIHPSDQKKDFS